MRFTHISTHTHTHTGTDLSFFEVSDSSVLLLDGLLLVATVLLKTPSLVLRRESVAQQWQVTWDLTSGLMMKSSAHLIVAAFLTFSQRVFGSLAQLCAFTGLEVRLYPLEGRSGGHSFPTLHPNFTHFCSLSGLNTNRQQKRIFVPNEGSFSSGHSLEPFSCFTWSTGLKPQFANWSEDAKTSNFTEYCTSQGSEQVHPAFTCEAMSY